jgi:prepilin-type N-terminal cleavage/methylation domain-containing protein/prepilin-type processing-associated H-X9-DG protein
MRRQSRGGFTLVELLVVIAIIGVLVGLLMPAMEGVRESARRNTCSNNLHQMAMGCLQHEERQGFLPTGGWASGWAGDPGRGFSNKQPGGWHYNILPYIEQMPLHQMGSGGNIALATSAAQTPVALFLCPSRHNVITFTYAGNAPGFKNINLSAGMPVARSDYAACAGDGITPTSWPTWAGPSTESQADNNMSESNWDAYGGTYTTAAGAPDATGVIFRRSMVKTAQIRNGISCTYLIGERYADPAYYSSGEVNVGNQGWDVGYDNVVNRWTGQNQSPTLGPMKDGSCPSSNSNCTLIFGSAHSGTFNMAMCDGSVHRMRYSIDPNVHRMLGNRTNRTPFDLTVIQ